MSNPSPGNNNRKSLAHHKRAGTYRKDRHADLKSPEPTTGAPDVPEGLTEVEAAEWGRMMWALEDMGALCKVDQFSVYQYCRLYGETERVAIQQTHTEASIDRLEENLGDFKGEEFVKLAQEIGTLNKLVSKCTDQLRAGRMAIRQYLVEFGLTPASRGRIKLPAKAEAVDEFTAFQKQRGAA